MIHHTTYAILPYLSNISAIAAKKWVAEVYKTSVFCFESRFHGSFATSGRVPNWGPDCCGHHAHELGVTSKIHGREPRGFPHGNRWKFQPKNRQKSKKAIKITTVYRYIYIYIVSLIFAWLFLGFFHQN